MALALVGGLLLLIAGAELLVRGSVRLAEELGVSKLLIGLTIVGFGTSTPELVTSVQGALVGSPGIAVGNIVGSNIFNILLILGLSAVICPIKVASAALRRDGVLVVATAILLMLIGFAWTLDRLTGSVLLMLLVTYLLFAWKQEQTASAQSGHSAVFEKAEALEGLDPGLAPHLHARTRGFADRVGAVLMALVGLALLVFGARYFVQGSIDLARQVNVSETIIGLTIVAAGTSMPELATSTLAAIRRQSDVAIGNVLGSNIYNILGIGGVTAVIAPTGVPPHIATIDSPIMVAASALLLLLLWTGRSLSRPEGALLVTGYVGYVAVLLAL